MLVDDYHKMIHGWHGQDRLLPRILSFEPRFVVQPLLSPDMV